MGAAQSGGVEIGGSSMGYQVLRVYPDSPGSKAGLKAYFDFIVAIGNTRFNNEDGSLREILKASVDQKIKMTVYNTRNKMVREVDIVPTTSWGGSGLLGVSIKHSSFEKADERVWHVTAVDPGSPAQQAGFKAMKDYVIGSDSILQESDDLYNLIETHEGKALKLFVYNVETDNCREIICHPNSKWGGRGFLGCEFGHGLLHRIPFTGDTGGDMGKPVVPSNSDQLSRANQQQQQQSNFGATTGQQNNLLQQQANLLNRTATQPGQQLFQQALASNQGSPKQQQQEIPKPLDKPAQSQPPPQAPQTFAQLASAQYQAQQYQQQTIQIQQQQQLLEQQRKQLEEQQRKMDELSASRQQAAPMPPTVGHNDSAPVTSGISQTYRPEQPPPTLPQQQHQTQAHQQNPVQSMTGEHQHPPDTQLPPQPSPTSQMNGQQSQAQQHDRQQFMPPHPANPYQQYPYGGLQSRQQQSPLDMNSSSPGESGLPPPPSSAAQTLPPPPTMYPPPPPPPSQAQTQSQPAPPLPAQQPPPTMFDSLM